MQSPLRTSFLPLPFCFSLGAVLTLLDSFWRLFYYQYILLNSHLKSDINTNKRQALLRLRDWYQYWKCLITISRPIPILESCHFDLDTDLDTNFVKISRQYRYDIDISAFLAIPTSISISNQSVSHITASNYKCKDLLSKIVPSINMIVIVGRHINM